ncbi:Phosphotransferase system cellobiose-specific component IIB [Serratia fonticola]|uniref:Phosphotransferase system cellobiose-specific component IIB n=1 Tax=Serratia fonticola TaxID=47917 RepID=A0A4U9U070_SERFO|nr:Phosphotransferase system cellobiose-specific component IIB [Serratia fonticola]
MKKIVLCCAAGMSTSMLVKRMQNRSAKARTGRGDCGGTGCGF